jgi:hypothetical protein
MTDTLVRKHGVAVLVCAGDGPLVASGQDAMDLIAEAIGHEADLVELPAARVAPEFFTLSSGLAGEVAQKFVNYRLRLAIVGDISGQLAASSALRAFVAETNRGRQLWLLGSSAEVDQRLSPLDHL